MELVVDANVVFSLLIASKQSRLPELFFKESLTLYAPEFLLRECTGHLPEIATKSGLSVKDIELLLTLVSSKIHFVAFSDFSEYLAQAKNSCPDQDDVEYFAVALKMKCPLWSEDKKLKQQGEISVFSTSDLLQSFS